MNPAVAPPLDTDRMLTKVAARQEPLDREVVLELDGGVVLALRPCGRSRYEDLIFAHPPTPEQREAGLFFDVDTFAPDLLAACAGDGMTIGQAAQLLCTVSPDDAAAIFATCMGIAYQRLAVTA